MKAPKIWMVIPALMVSCVIGLAYAKLPVSPPSEEAKAAAAAKKAKGAEAAKKASEALAKAQDRAAGNYKKGKGMKPITTAMPAEKMKK